MNYALFTVITAISVAPQAFAIGMAIEERPFNDLIPRIEQHLSHPDEARKLAVECMALLTPDRFSERNGASLHIDSAARAVVALLKSPHLATEDILHSKDPVLVCVDQYLALLSKNIDQAWDSKAVHDFAPLPNGLTVDERGYPDKIRDPQLRALTKDVRDKNWKKQLKDTQQITLLFARQVVLDALAGSRWDKRQVLARFGKDAAFREYLKQEIEKRAAKKPDAKTTKPAN